MKKPIIILAAIISLPVLFFSFVSHSQSNNPSVTISLERFERMEKQIASLKRVQEALIQMDSETWNSVAEIIEKQDGIVFPRTDHICPDTMVHVKLNSGTGAALLANTCEMEADLWESE